MERYSAAPIVCLDGPDADNHRAEVHVIKGVGTPALDMESKSGKSAKYKFAVDNTEYPPGGWVQIGSKVQVLLDEVIKENLLAGAGAEKVNIEFRIEKKRGTKYQSLENRKRPIKEIAELDDKQSTIRNIAAVRRANTDDEFIFSEFAVTNPAEDPSDGFGGSSALNFSVDELRQRTAHLDAAPKTTSGNSSRTFSMYKTDGSLNAGSFGAGAPLSVIIFLNEFIRELAKSDDNFPRRGVTKIKQMESYGLKMTEAVCEIEKNISGKTVADLNSQENSRARALLFESIRMTSIPPEALKYETAKDKEANGGAVSFDEWLNYVVGNALKIWGANLEIISRVSAPSENN